MDVCGGWILTPKAVQNDEKHVLGGTVEHPSPRAEVLSAVFWALELVWATWQTYARSMPRKESTIKLIYFNGKPWTRREVLIWLSALILAVILGVLIVTNVLGSWALLVAPFLASGVGLMRFRAEKQRLDEGPEAPDSP
jgi:fatty acid desaturase